MLFDGLTQPEISARLRSPECVVLSQTTSTLDIVHELAKDGAPDRTLVIADEQTRGRGRMGRGWKATPGNGLLMGYLHRPEAQGESGVLALRIGLIVRDVLLAAGVPAECKWPNDVLADGKKISGILCEGRWDGNQVDWIAVGVGVNVHGPVPSEFGETATAVDAYFHSPTRIAILEGVVAGLHRVSTAPKLTGEEVADFESRHWLTGKKILEPIGGTVEGINDAGALLVRTQDRQEAISGGHVVVA